MLVEINFLCIHKKLRSHRLAPVLIREVGCTQSASVPLPSLPLAVGLVRTILHISGLGSAAYILQADRSLGHMWKVTRRVNREGIFQASYTAGVGQASIGIIGNINIRCSSPRQHATHRSFLSILGWSAAVQVLLPRPIAKCRYWHRSLSPKKLIDIRFSHLGRNETMAKTIKKYKVRSLRQRMLNVVRECPDSRALRESTRATKQNRESLVSTAPPVQWGCCFFPTAGPGGATHSRDSCYDCRRCSGGLCPARGIPRKVLNSQSLTFLAVYLASYTSMG